jgi:hypothetical protein
LNIAIKREIFLMFNLKITEMKKAMILSVLFVFMLAVAVPASVLANEPAKKEVSKTEKKEVGKADTKKVDAKKNEAKKMDAKKPEAKKVK